MKILLAIFLLIGTRLAAQVNLVPNYSFEDTISCIDSPDSLQFLQYWNNPTSGTPDVFSVNYCNNYSFSSNIQLPNNQWVGFQHPKSGANCAGIAVFDNQLDGTREYLQVKLTTTLKPNTAYCVEMYTSLANKCSRYAIKDLGIHFNTDSIHYDSLNYPVISYTERNIIASDYISDTLNWTKISGIYYATGGEKYILVGNFKAKFQTDYVLNYPQSGALTYYYIDDVAVYECDSLIGIKEEPVIPIKVYPNPATNSVSIDMPTGYPNPQLYIYNLTGQLVATKPVQPKQPVPIAELSAGMYIFAIQSNNTLIGREKVVVY